MIDKIGRSEQADLFTGERHEQNGPFPLLSVLRRKSCNLENTRCAGSVVVRAVMYLSDLRRRQRTAITKPEMIIVRADDYPFFSQCGVGSGKTGQDILHDFVCTSDVRRNVYTRSGNIKGTGLQVCVNRLLN